MVKQLGVNHNGDINIAKKLIDVARTKNNTSRPKFIDSFSFEKLLKQREPIYLKADFVVITDSKSPKEIAREISLLID